MKNMFESPEVFEAYARIDFNYLLMQKNLELLNAIENDTRPVLHKLADHVTGALMKKLEQIASTTIELSENIIADKKFIAADTACTEKTLQKLKDKYKKHFGHEYTKTNSEKAN